MPELFPVTTGALIALTLDEASSVPPNAVGRSDAGRNDRADGDSITRSTIGSRLTSVEILLLAPPVAGTATVTLG